MNLINVSKESNFIEYWEENGTDTKKAFLKNRKTLGKDWIYNYKNVLYEYNEHGFRTKPFNKVDWNKSIVILGCSYVKGTGVAVEDTISYQLENILGIPVVNLGVSGAAIDCTCWNSLILHNYYGYPKAVIQLWTSLDRYTDLEGIHYKSYMPHKKNYSLIHNWKDRSKFYVMADRELWKNKTTYCEGSLFFDTATELNVECYPILDKARDLIHPGISSLKNVAEDLANTLIELGISKVEKEEK